MKNTLTMLRTGLMLTLSLMLICGVIYPAATTAVGQLAFNSKANGSIIYVDGTAVGSELIGQDFTEAGYFKGRPSGSPLPAVDPAVVTTAEERLAQLGLDSAPADLVTHSGSGVDPHISLDSAAVQLPAVAAATGIPDSELQAMISANTTHRFLGVYGEEYVNVLGVNLAIDAYKKSHP